jgi:outer membrane lipoprotein-sorting protein
MRIFRTLPTRRLFALLGVAGALVVIATTVAVAARGGSGPTPAPEPLANAIHDALAAPTPEGITAQVQFTNNLFPSGALLGQSASPLLASASGRLWVNADGGRLELQSDSGDAQIVWTTSKVTVYDGTSNTAYVFDLPQSAEPDPSTTNPLPSVDEITNFLARVGAHWSISSAQPDNVAGEEAYTVDVSPKQDGGLVGSAEIAWDALKGVPLRVAIYAKGSTTPALALEATDITFGPVSASTIAITPPANAKTVDLSTGSGTQSGSGEPTPVLGVDAVLAAAPWAVVPQSVTGLSLQDVRLVGPADSRAVVAVYGQGLGSVVVAERQKTSTAADSQSSSLSSLPTVSLDGVDAHELSTQLGTGLTWERNGVSYVLAGSLSAAAAEAAARALG